MTKFLYKARDQFGLEVAGALDVDKAEDVVVYLDERGFLPVSVHKEEQSAINLSSYFSRYEKIRIRDVIIFTRQLESLLESGVPLLESLVAVRDQVISEKFRSIINSVKKSIEEGSSFSDALEKFPEAFSPFVVNMIRAGERAGILADVLSRLSGLLEKDLDTQNKIKTAVRYPMFVLITLGVGFTIVITFVVPRFASIFSSFKAELPLPTRILVGLNYAITKYWYMLLAVLGLGVYGFKKYAETTDGKFNVDKFILTIPIFGQLFLKLSLSRFTRMLSAMMSSGITIVEALGVSAKITDNALISKVILGIKDEVIGGQNVSSAMKGAKLFPAIVVQMVAVGEKTGKLEDMLNRVADYFDRETEYTISNLTSLIEPFLILFLACMVLLLAMGVFLPMWGMMQLYSQ